MCIRDRPQGNAQNNAASFLGVTQDKLTHTQDSEGGLPTYNFDCGTIRISVTKAGGIVSAMTDGREIGGTRLDADGARTAAQGFLEAKGIYNMKESYYVINDGICTINYAYSQDGVTCYPDLVKVAVALDTGGVVEYNATGYIMNHTDRGTLTPKITQEEAQKSVSPRLKVEGGSLALIPTPGLNEVSVSYTHLDVYKRQQQRIQQARAGIPDNPFTFERLWCMERHDLSGLFPRKGQRVCSSLRTEKNSCAHSGKEFGQLVKVCIRMRIQDHGIVQEAHCRLSCLDPETRERMYEAIGIGCSTNPTGKSVSCEGNERIFTFHRPDHSPPAIFSARRSISVSASWKSFWEMILTAECRYRQGKDTATVRTPPRATWIAPASLPPATACLVWQETPVS